MRCIATSAARQRAVLADEAGERTFNELGPDGEVPAASVTDEIKI